MRAEDLRLRPRLRAFTYVTICVLFATGTAWWALQCWGNVETEFGTAANPAAPWLLRAHGAAAMLSLLVFGWLLPVHVLPGWRLRRNLRAGAGIVFTLAALTVTGWLLYYAGGEDLRAFASTVHSWLGLALPMIIAAHVWFGRRSRPAVRRHRGGHPASGQ